MIKFQTILEGMQLPFLHASRYIVASSTQPLVTKQNTTGIDSMLQAISHAVWYKRLSQ